MHVGATEVEEALRLTENVVVAAHGGLFPDAAAGPWG